MATEAGSAVHCGSDVIAVPSWPPEQCCWGGLRSFLLLLVTFVMPGNLKSIFRNVMNYSVTERRSFRPALRLFWVFLNRNVGSSCVPLIFPSFYLSRSRSRSKPFKNLQIKSFLASSPAWQRSHERRRPAKAPKMRRCEVGLLHGDSGLMVE